MKRRLITIALLIGMLSVLSVAQGSAQASGSVQGIVFAVDPDGGRSVVPGTKISVDGPTHLEGTADDEGKFTFKDVPVGAYKLNAEGYGLTGSQDFSIEAGKASQVELKMKVQAVAESVNVTATADAPDTKEASGTSTIAQATVEHMPNRDERFENLLPLVPGVVRGPNGKINMKGAQATQNGSLVNSADVTDPATGESAINIPIDVVSSVQVFSTPYAPEFGKFTGAVSNVETRPGNLEKFRLSAQNLLPRPRRLDGTIMGLAAVTPRFTLTGPIVKNRIAFTQSVEYRYERYPVNSLPALRRDTRSEAFDTYTQIDATISKNQTATGSFAIFPQKLRYFGLNTFTPQESTPDLHKRGYQFYVQHRYVTDSGNLLTSQLSYRNYDADLLPNSDAPYQLLVETTKGGFFNRQNRETSRTEWEEVFRSRPRRFAGSHELSAGVSFAHSSYDGRQQFRPVDIVGTAGYALQRIEFGPESEFSIDQNEIAWFAGDKWSVSERLAFDLGLRFDRDSVTDATNVAPRIGFVLSLTRDAKTVLKGGAGYFYDRVPLNVPAFSFLPGRSVLSLDPQGRVVDSTHYTNEITRGLRNPRSEVWNLELDRRLTTNLLVRAAYQQRKTVDGYLVDPLAFGSTGVLAMSDAGNSFYREFQLTARYQLGQSTLNASYVRSKTFGDLNDVNQFFGNDPQAVIQPNQRSRLSFDAPNRFLTWAEIAAPWKLTISPVLDVHTGFPYSTINQNRTFVGPRNELRFPRFVSADLQVLRSVRLPVLRRRARIGFAVLNVFNHPNYRDVQNNIDSDRFGEFFNGVSRTFHGKLVFEF